MQNLISVWTALDTRRKLVAGLAALAMVATVFGLTRVASQTSTSLLYAGLESGAAGQVIASLEQRGVAYEVRGGAIYVDASKRDELRMTLASEGLPANGAVGYELLDSLNGFGTTSQMFDAAYWRAKEGELARTILGNREITSARVHISNTSSSPFERNRKSTASVTVTSAVGSVQPSHAKALKYLVASAVAGLNPEDVSVIDGGNGRVLTADEEGTSSSEDATSDKIRDRVQRLMEARVGVGNAIVEVSVEKVMDRESIVERRFDPESRVTISKETEERTTDSKDSGGGNVTVASNLPEGDGAGDRSSSSQNSETRERVNFEVSETQREIQRGPGAIKRLSVAVLVDGVRTIAENGEVSWAPRSEEELATLRDLVASAVGFSAERGDEITLRTLEFQAPEALGTEAAQSAGSGMNLDMMALIQLGVLAVVALLLGLFVVRPILAKPPQEALPAPQEALGDTGSTTSLVASGGSQDNVIELSEVPQATMITSDAGGANVVSAQNGDAAGELELPLPLALDLDFEDGQPEQAAAFEKETFDEIEDPVERLRKLIDERREETVEILRGWVDAPQEDA